MVDKGTRQSTCAVAGVEDACRIERDVDGTGHVRREVAGHIEDRLSGRPLLGATKVIERVTPAPRATVTALARSSPTGKLRVELVGLFVATGPM